MRRNFKVWTFLAAMVLGFAAVGALVTDAHAEPLAVYDDGSVAEYVGDTLTVSGAEVSLPFSPAALDDRGYAAAVIGEPLTIEQPEGLYVNGSRYGEPVTMKLPARTFTGSTGVLRVCDVRTGDVVYEYSGEAGFVPFDVIESATRRRGGFTVRLFNPEPTEAFPRGRWRIIIVWPNETWNRTTWEAVWPGGSFDYGLGLDWQQIDNADDRPEGFSADPQYELPEAWSMMTLAIDTEDAWRLTEVSAFVPPRFVCLAVPAHEPAYTYRRLSLPWVRWNYERAPFVVDDDGQPVYREFQTVTNGMGEYGLPDGRKHANGSMIPWLAGGASGPVFSPLDIRYTHVNDMGCAVVVGEHVPDASRPGSLYVETGAALYIPGEMRRDAVRPEFFAPPERADVHGEYWPLDSPDGNAGIVLGVCPTETPAPRVGVIGYDLTRRRFYVTGPMCMGVDGWGWERYGEPEDFVRVTARHIVWRDGITPAPWWGGPTDLNIDARTDTADLGYLLSRFGETCGDCLADINGDGVVDTADLGLLVSRFGT